MAPVGVPFADVAACTETLIERTLLGRRLARISGGEVLAQNQVARLCVLASLHNFGQFSIAFQNKRLDRPPFPTRGHPREALGLLNDGYRFADRAWEYLALEEIATWGEDMDVHAPSRGESSSPQQPLRGMRRGPYFVQNSHQ